MSLQADKGSTIIYTVIRGEAMLRPELRRAARWVYIYILMLETTGREKHMLTVQ